MQQNAVMITHLDQDFSQLTEFIESLKPSRLFFLVDENTHELCLPVVLANLETDIPLEILEIEAGEEMKTLETAAQLWKILTEFKADRNALLINVGGGVITDLGGFVASAYKRGIKFVHIPTTLLGMCDASIGGKTGVDLNYVKNVVGSFALPEHNFLHAGFLKTLDVDNLRSGFAEMLKHGLIADAEHWNSLAGITEHTVELIKPHLFDSMKIKQKIVEQDFFEKSLRKSLNFGHTIGHAVESLILGSGNTVTHGDAVAMGMICETWLSAKTGNLSTAESEKITETIMRFFPPLDIGVFSDSDFLDLMSNDKKNSNGIINFTLLSEIGITKTDCSVPNELIFEILKTYRRYSVVS